jgi:uncharacterized SAM-binding protein YcdF (DUF218 family)
MKRFRLTTLIAGMAASLLFVGFFWFAGLADKTGGPAARANAIVVLTGKAPRIGAAMTLLSAARGKRLLITGVNRATTKSALKRRFKAYAALLDCCIDLDRQAMNTRGNADQAAKWVKTHGFKSLLLVTSGYHMPRSLLEFRHKMPDIALIAHATGPPSGRFWQSRAAFRGLLEEYAKYVLALCRIHLFERFLGRTGLAG